MTGYVQNIEELTLANDSFRKVIYTARHCQVVLMSLNPNEDIGEEVHDVDQFLRIEQGTGQTILDGTVSDIKDGSVVVVPAGVKHNIINTGSDKMKLYTLYAPPHHKDQIVHATKAEAEASDEHFDGNITE